MKKYLPILMLLLIAISANSQFVFRTNGTQYITGKLAIYPNGSSPDNGYNGNLTITKPIISGQYLNLVRQSRIPWSIGMVYDTSRFAIGVGTPDDSQFTNPFFVIGTTGNVGIGAVDPQSKLQVNGPVLFENGNLTLKSDLVLGPAEKQFLFHTQSDFPNNPPIIYLTPKESGSWNFNKSIIFNHEGAILMKTPKLGVGTTTPFNNFEVVNSDPNTLDIAGFYNTYAYDITKKAETRINLGKIEGTSRQPMGAVGAFPSSNNSSDNGNLVFYTRNTQNIIERVRIDHDGKVGIGTTSPDEMLTVNGKIHAKEVIISLTGPLADYVFDPDYQLTPLLEVEQFVNKHRHLPEIPSASEVEKNGLSMGEMQNKLLQKIEELTLYIIQQNNRISELEKKLSK